MTQPYILPRNPSFSLFNHLSGRLPSKLLPLQLGLSGSRWQFSDQLGGEVDGHDIVNPIEENTP